MLKSDKVKQVYYVYMDNAMGQWHPYSKSLFLHKNLKRFDLLHDAVVKHELRHSEIREYKILGFDLNFYQHILIDADDMIRLHSMPQFWEFTKISTDYKSWHFLAGIDSLIYFLAISLIAAISIPIGYLINTLRGKT